MVSEVAGDTTSDVELLFAELGKHELGDQQLRDIGHTAVFLLANPELFHEASQENPPDDRLDLAKHRVIGAIGAAICLYPDPEEIPLSLRSVITLRIAPEFERRGPKRGDNYDGLAQMKNRAAFELVKPSADQDPETYFGLVDCKGIKALNNTVTYDAGSALIRFTAVCVKVVALELGIENDVYIIGNDDFAAIGPAETIGRFIQGVLKMFSSHIESGKSLVDWQDKFYPIELYKDVVLGLHVGSGPTFAEAWEQIKESKAAE